MPEYTRTGNQDFGGTSRIIGLPPATAPGQPVVLEQLGGGAAVQSLAIDIPDFTDYHEQPLAVPGITSANSVQCWFASTVDDDENGLELMAPGTTVNANCSQDLITFVFTSPNPEAGIFNIKYRVY